MVRQVIRKDVIGGKPTNIVIDKEDSYLGNAEEEEFEDRLDLYKHALRIHQKHSYISPDVVLFMSDEKDMEFFRTMHANAYRARLLIADKRVATKCQEFLVNQCILVAAMKRNRYENPLLSRIFARPVSEDEGDEKENEGKKLGGKVVP